ncbi:MAG: hypothetical protein HW385_1154, partial [candidate division NC10 bacterium]|nr:hypothetical protein [candidate division NC10 bacterium]
RLRLTNLRLGRADGEVSSCEVADCMLVVLAGTASATEWSVDYTPVTFSADL